MNSIFGGLLIGIAASVMLLFNGRIIGISSIIEGILHSHTKDRNWRVLFLLGLFSGGIILKLFFPQTLNVITHVQTFDYLLAGFLVGFGTMLGSGCTSGHGVCGISRFSIRSIVATVVFIVAGIVSVAIFKRLRGEL